MKTINNKLEGAGIEFKQSAKKKIYDRVRYNWRTKTSDEPCSSFGEQMDTSGVHSIFH